MMHYYNDNDNHCCAVLHQRIREGNLPGGPVDGRNIESINDFGDYDQYHLFAGIGGIALGLQLAGFPGHESILTGGFPCQDVSCAGKGAGLSGARSGLWREMARAIRLVRPRFVLVENVAALLQRGMGVVLGDLAEDGYDAEWDCVQAAEVGAPHRRERVFILAHPHR